MRTMDLTYPPEAEEFRVVIRRWLTENLPETWGDPDFAMTAEQRKEFNKEWTAKLFGGGWICASWPAEYGGKGLSLLEQVVLNEEFAACRSASARRLLRRHARRADAAAMGHRGAEEAIHPRDPQGRDRLVPGFQRAGCGLRPGFAQDAGRARRRRVGHQRPEGLDHPGPVRRLHLLVGQDRPQRAQARRDLVPARAHEARGSGGPADPADRRHRGVQRGVLHQRSLPEGERRRRCQQRLEGRHDDARFRTRHLLDDRPSPLPEGIRPDPRPGPNQGTDRGPPDPAAAGAVVVEDQDHADQRLAHPDRRSGGHACHRPLERLQQDVLVGGPPGDVVAGHGHPGHGGPDPPGRHRWRRARGRRSAFERPLPRRRHPVVVLLLAFGDDLGRYGRDPAQHRGRARPRPAQGAQGSRKAP